MHSKLFPILGLMVVLSAGAVAQNNPTQNISGPNATVRNNALELDLANFLESDDDDDIATGMTRPRFVKIKAAAVKSAVVVNVSSVERVAFEMLNQKRRENGLHSLAWNADLCNVARVHSQNMAEFDFFAHRGLDGKMVSDRADTVGLGKWSSIGENIAFNRGYQDPVGKAVELWLNSATHRSNLMSENWKESAVGVAIRADGSYYFTQVFLARK